MTIHEAIRRHAHGGASTEAVTTAILSERTSAQFISASTSKDRSRATVVESNYVTLQETNGMLTFRSTAVTTESANFWSQRIHSDALRDLAKKRKKVTTEEVKAALEGDLRVSCSCPHFLYGGFRYILSSKDEVVGAKETRSPDIRNPKQEGALCKHLVSVMKSITEFSAAIAEDFNKTK